MLTLLAKYFISDYRATHLPEVRGAYGILCSITGIVLNVFLFVFKMIAGILSGSVAIVADAVNNLSDAGSSLILLIGFRLSRAKPDPDHPFGHGRIEYVSGFIVSLLIMLMGFELMKSSAEKIFGESEPIVSSIVVIIILAVSVLVKIYMAFYNFAISKKIDSAAMRATATDSLGDSIATSVVLAATLIAHFTGWNIDGYCGVLVSLFILAAGYSASKNTLGPLVGQPPRPELVEQIKEIVMAPPEILGIHDLIVHDYGPGRLMITVHAEVAHDSDMFAIHDVIDDLEITLQKKLGCEAVIHMDPIETDDEATDQAKKMVIDAVYAFDPILSIHDFRVVVGQTHTNLIFDLVVPYDYKYSESQVKKLIAEKIRDAGGDIEYRAVMHIDRSFMG